jgi:predicted transcriptional regulator
LLPEPIQNQLPDIVRGLAFTSFFLFAPIVQIFRFRRVSTNIERQQTKWVVYGASLSFGFIALGSMAFLLFPGFLGDRIATVVLNWFLGLILLSLPISIGFAILRYKLWDIDIIIRRTLVWSAMTIFLGGVYFGGVTLLQSIFTAMSGQQSPLAIVLSTLAIAALFNPLRKRIQEFVDRRFYRRKYNADQALASFAALAREEVDLEEITARLLLVVGETVQPEQVSLWLKPIGNKSK